MRWPWQKEAVEPIFSQTPQTPGQALDAAMTEQRQQDDGAVLEMLSDLRALYDALAVKYAGLDGRMQALEAGIVQRDVETNWLISRVRALEDGT